METYLKISNIGSKKCKQNLGKQFFSSILSGAFLGFGAACSFRVGSLFPERYIGLKRLITGLFGLPIGLMLIVLCETQLFTGNTSFYTISFLEKKIKILRSIISLLVIYLGNLVGSLIFAALIYGSEVLKDNFEVIDIAEKKIEVNWGSTFLRGLLCNWFVCLSLWQAVSAKTVSGKAFGIYPTISGFVALGLEHSIANMYIIPQGIMLGAKVSILDFILHNLIPVTLGNIVSGVIFVGVILSYIHRINDD
tara:strand:- start:1478 stop:2230 length:753 start_codon:yes stop_codon:yes gene_type:complete